MKKKNLLFAFCALVLITATAGTLIDSGKSGKTDSPGEGNCSSCHNNSTVNTGGGYVAFSSNIPNDVYTPGMTYQVTITVNEAGTTLFGFGVEALNSGNTNAGTFVITNAAETHLMTAGNGRINVVHQLNGGLVTTPGSKDFTFNWTAPATDIGYVKFYVASVAAINDQDPATDNTYTTFKTINSPTVTATQELNSEIRFSIYPNPVKDVMNIYLSENNSLNGSLKAELYSVTGQKVMDLINAANGNVSKENHIPVPSSIADGIYFVKIEQGGMASSKRILIQH